MCMCEEHEFVMPGLLDEELTEMLVNVTMTWKGLKVELDREAELEPTSPPSECSGNSLGTLSVTRYFLYYTQRCNQFFFSESILRVQ